MGVWGEGTGWCFCGGGGRSERLKESIIAGKGPAIASISSGASVGGIGTGFLIQQNLLLTTHGTLPSVTAAEAAEIQLNQDHLCARLVPSRFFITSSVLDLTIVGLDTADTKMNSQSHQPHYLKTCGNPSLDLGNAVYLLTFTNTNELIVGEAKVVIATDNLVKLSAEGTAWRPGSAGFDAHGNLALMICDPMKLASSPATKSSYASSSPEVSCKGDSPMLFGIPIPIICDWLHQHLEGSLDELNKPKLPRIRLLSTGLKSEHSCASFSQRQIFKPPDEDDENISSSSHTTWKFKYQQEASSSANASTHAQGISTPEIYESPKLTSGPFRKKENTPAQLLDINFPPRAPRSIALPLPLKQLFSEPSENINKDSNARNLSREDDCCSEVQSSSSPAEVFELPNEVEGFSSAEETMYSAETMESRNIPSPTRESHFHQVGRSQSCVNYSRWASSQRNTTKRRGVLQKQHSMIPARKAKSHAASLPQKSHEYYSPTLSSSMKKRNGLDQSSAKLRQSAVQVSPRWML